VYKLLLCGRYLLTRYLAFVCIVSVMLGVATLIVVNSVMSGFSSKLKERLHGLLSDVMVESVSLEGFADPADKMRRIAASPVGHLIEAMSPQIEVFAMMQFRVGYRGELITRPCKLIGLDPDSRAKVGGFAEFLENPRNRQRPSFALSEEAQRRQLLLHPPLPELPGPLDFARPGEPPPPQWDTPIAPPKVARGIIVGHAIATYRDKNAPLGESARDIVLLHPGDDVTITTVGAQRLQPVYDRFAVCDYFKSEMSEYDANYVFVPLDYLQRLRTMEDRVTSIQIRLKDPEQAAAVRDALQRIFPASTYQVHTWQDKQGPLLAAIGIERNLLNIILFMIIVVAGFGILAIFSMIVVEKTRDIGILKSLGATTLGIMSIFVGYGLLLGVVGAALGTVLGLAITDNINEIERFIARSTGQAIFPRDVYYFNMIPTNVQPGNVVLINVGAILTAVIFSVAPALRAATLHPVRALRYE
jgi:lipoprotein-releasing system permease protein